jgi:hypothetical protein
MTTLPAFPLSGQQWVEAIEKLEDLWPGTRTWGTADKLYEMFRPYTAELIDRAITKLFAEGRQTAPSPSSLMGTVRALAAEAGVPLPEQTGPCEHPHLTHIAPSDQGATPFLTGAKGPGRLECAGCRHPLGSCHCQERCRKDRLYAPSAA